MLCGLLLPAGLLYALAWLSMYLAASNAEGRDCGPLPEFPRSRYDATLGSSPVIYDGPEGWKMRLARAQAAAPRQITGLQRPLEDFFAANWQPVVGCAYAERVGGRWICDPRVVLRARPRPVVYVVGASDFAWDGARLFRERPAGRIDLLVAEGEELAAVAALAENGTLRAADQLLLRMHRRATFLDIWGYVGPRARERHGILLKLLEHNLELFHRDCAHPHYCDLSFVRVEWHKSMPPATYRRVWWNFKNQEYDWVEYDSVTRQPVARSPNAPVFPEPKSA